MAATIKVKFVGDAKHLNRTISKTQRTMNGFARAAKLGGAALAAGIAVGVAKSVTSFVSFEESLNRSQSIMGDLTQNQMTAMEEAAREMGKTTTFSAQEAAQAFYFLASAGLDVEQQLAALPAVAEFAQAGMFDLSTATDLLTDAQSALGLGSDNTAEHLENMVRLSDVLITASTLANASAEEFSLSLTTKSATAMANWGVSLEEGVAVLAVLADKGVKGELAGTNFATMLTNMTTAASKNKEAFEEWGIAVFDSQGNVSGLAEIVEDLENAFDGLTDEEKKAALLQLGFADKAQKTLLALLGTSDAIREYTEELEAAGGMTKEVAEKQLQTLSAKFDLLKGKIEDMAITLGGNLEPAITSVIGFFEELSDAYDPEVIEFGPLAGTTTSIGGLAGVIALLDEKSKLIIPTLTALAALLIGVMVVGVVALVTAMSPLVLIVAGVALAVTGLTAGFTYLYRENETFRGAVDKVVDVLQWLWDKILGIVDAIGGWGTVLAFLAGPIGVAILVFVKFRDEITAAARWVGEKILDIVGFVRALPGKIAGFATGVFDGIKNAITGAWNWVRDKISGIVGFVTSLPGRIGSLGSAMFDGIKTAITSAWQWVKDKVAGIVGFVKGIALLLAYTQFSMFNGIITAMSSAWRWVRDKVDGIVAFVLGIKDTVDDGAAGLFDAIKNAIQDAFDFVVDLLNKFPGINIPVTVETKRLNPIPGRDNENGGGGGGGGGAVRLLDYEPGSDNRGSGPGNPGFRVGNGGRLVSTDPSPSGPISEWTGQPVQPSPGPEPGPTQKEIDDYLELLYQNQLAEDRRKRAASGGSGITPGSGNSNQRSGTNYFAEGGLITEPTVGVIGEGGEDEIISPIPTMRKVMDEALAARGGGPPSITIGEINMRTDADINDLSRELRWLQVTQGAA